MRISRGIKEILFKLDAWHIIALAGIALITVILISLYALSHLVLNGPTKYYVLIGIALFLLLNRMTIITRYGVRFSYFLLFGIVLIFGPIVAFLVRVPLSLIHIKLATIPTPVDFMMRKEVDMLIRRDIYATILIVLLALMKAIYGLEYILANLVFMFMAMFALWSALLFVRRLIFGKNVVHWRSAMVLVSAVLNYWLVVNFGTIYIAYLMSL